MIWVLVLVGVMSTGDIIAQDEGRFATMEDCFWAREVLSHEVGGSQGYYPMNMQAVCIKTDDTE